MKLVFKITKYLFICFVSFFLLHTVINSFWGLSAKAQKADVIVVYGNKVNKDKTPSRRLAARLDKTIAVYNAGLANFIIVTGGIDPNGHDEAAIMKDYLIKKGEIPGAKIVVDNNGINTEHSVLFVKNFLRQNKLESVINISQYSHLMRIHLAMKKAGLIKINSAPADYYFELRNIYTAFREFAAFYYYLLKY